MVKGGYSRRREKSRREEDNSWKDNLLVEAEEQDTIGAEEVEMG